LGTNYFEMKISGFTFIRNGCSFGYPFIESIKSILPVCEEFVIVVGDCDDGTREAILEIGSPKIRIIDTIWDETLRSNGTIFANQTNIALKELTGDWAFYLQADEIINENDLDAILKKVQEFDKDPEVEGFLFDFLNFHGSYNYLNDTRYQHTKEIRIVRTGINVFSYRDAQGFRRYPSFEEYNNNHPGVKLKVVHLHVPLYHYNYVRNPEQMNVKSKHFEAFYHDDGYLKKKYQDVREFDYYNIERVKRFTGNHPAVMKDIVKNQNWDFDPEKIHRKLSAKDRAVYFIEDVIKYRIGEYRNYSVIH